MASMDSSAAAAPIDALAPAPRPSVTFTPSWMRLSAWLWLKACASVLATTKSTPSRALSIMLFSALPPAPPTPNTVMRGFNSSCPGTERFKVMCLSACYLSPIRSVFCAYSPQYYRLSMATSRKKRGFGTKSGPIKRFDRGILPNPRDVAESCGLTPRHAEVAARRRLSKTGNVLTLLSFADLLSASCGTVPQRLGAIQHMTGPQLRKNTLRKHHRTASWRARRPQGAGHMLSSVPVSTGPSKWTREKSHISCHRKTDI